MRISTGARGAGGRRRRGSGGANDSSEGAEGHSIQVDRDLPGKLRSSRDAGNRAGRQYPPGRRGHFPRCCRSATRAPCSGLPSWASRRRWAARRSAAHASPRVFVLITGDELTPPGEPLAPGGIYGSNGFALAAQVERAGGALAGRGTVPDTPEGTRAALEEALDAADVVIVSGGVSVGPHDHVKDALRDLGVEERFWGVRLRPGKPTWFGSARRYARVRPARQSRIGDGDLPALRAPRARGASGRGA